MRGGEAGRLPAKGAPSSQLPLWAKISDSGSSGGPRLTQWMDKGAGVEMPSPQRGSRVTPAALTPAFPVLCVDPKWALLADRVLRKGSQGWRVLGAEVDGSGDRGGH